MMRDKDTQLCTHAQTAAARSTALALGVIGRYDFKVVQPLHLHVLGGKEEIEQREELESAINAEAHKHASYHS